MGWERGDIRAKALELCCKQSKQEKLGIALGKRRLSHPQEMGCLRQVEAAGWRHHWKEP